MRPTGTGASSTWGTFGSESVPTDAPLPRGDAYNSSGLAAATGQAPPRQPVLAGRASPREAQGCPLAPCRPLHQRNSASSPERPRVRMETGAAGLLPPATIRRRPDTSPSCTLHPWFYGCVNQGQPLVYWIFCLLCVCVCVQWLFEMVAEMRLKKLFRTRNEHLSLRCCKRKKAVGCDYSPD